MVRRVLLVTLLSALSTAVSAPTARAVDAETYILRDAVQTFSDVLPCLGNLGPFDITITFDLALHETAEAIDLADAEDPFDDILTPPWHFTATVTGDFVAIPEDPSAPSYTGRYTQWFDANSNQASFAESETFTLIGQGTDGSTVMFQGTAHLSVTPNGQVLGFEKPACRREKDRAS